MFLALRKSAVPEGGWTRENFGRAERERLWRDQVRATKGETARGIKNLLPTLTRLFERYVNEVAERVLAAYDRTGRDLPGKAPRAITLEGLTGDLSVWAQAIDDVLGVADAEMLLEVTPQIQSVLDATYAKHSILLGVADPVATAAASSHLRLDRARSLASRITNINETTRRRINLSVTRAYEAGLSPRAVAKQIMADAPGIATYRIPTIARTEMGRAADEGTKQAMLDSGVVAYASVIGCSAIEPNIPTYNGVPTCNIDNVPVRDVDQLEFHINHTGVIVASGFGGADGSVEAREVGSNPELDPGRGGVRVDPPVESLPGSPAPVGLPPRPRA